MNVKQLKVHITRGIIRPEYFYLPLKAKKVLKNPFKYRVKSETVEMSFPMYITKIVLIEASHIMTTSSSGNTVNARIDWGDNTYTDVAYANREGYYQDSDGTRVDITTSTNLALSHTYTDAADSHIISIEGKCACVQLKKYPVAVVQWGDVGFEMFNDFINGSSADSPCRKEFSIPDTPITGCENVEYISNMFGYTALKAIPDKLFTRMINLKYFNWIFYYNDKLTKVGDEIFKGLSKLGYINGFCTYSDNLIEAGDSIFEDCVSIGAYGGMAGNGSWTTAFNSNYRFKKLGKNTFKNCVGLQSLISESTTSASSFYFGATWFPEGCKCTIGAGTFEGCTELKDISSIFSDSGITYFPADTFKGCTKIKFAEQAFSELLFPFRCGDGIFDEMENLTDIQYAFSGTALDNIPKFPNSPITNLKNAFYNAGKGRGTHSVYETELPTLTGNNFYMIASNSDRRKNMTAENINDYYEIWHVKTLDCTDMIPKANNITDATLAFYNYSELYNQDESVPSGWSKYLNYDSIWVGEMMPIWEKLDSGVGSSALNQALRGCQGISNLNTIPDSVVNSSSIIGYQKSGDLASLSNTELMRYFGDRLISEWSD